MALQHEAKGPSAERKGVRLHPGVDNYATKTTRPHPPRRFKSWYGGKATVAGCCTTGVLNSFHPIRISEVLLFAFLQPTAMSLEAVPMETCAASAEAPPDLAALSSPRHMQMQFGGPPTHEGALESAKPGLLVLRSMLEVTYPFVCIFVGPAVGMPKFYELACVLRCPCRGVHWWLDFSSIGLLDNLDIFK